MTFFLIPYLAYFLELIFCLKVDECRFQALFTHLHLINRITLIQHEFELDVHTYVEYIQGLMVSKYDGFLLKCAGSFF